MWTPSSSWAVFCPSITSTGPRWPGNSREAGGNGDGSPICCAERGGIPEPLVGFTWRWCSMCCYLGRSCGFSHPSFCEWWGASIIGWQEVFWYGYHSVITASGSNPQFLRRWWKRGWSWLRNIFPATTPVCHSTYSWDWYLTLRWWRSGGQSPRQPCACVNINGYGSAMRGGGRTSQGRIGNNSLVDYYPIVIESNCSVATYWGWNTTTHDILACHRAAEAGKKKKNKYIIEKSNYSSKFL